MTFSQAVFTQDQDVDVSFAEHHKSTYKMKIGNIIEEFTCFNDGPVLCSMQNPHAISNWHPDEHNKVDELDKRVHDLANLCTVFLNRGILLPSKQ